MDSFFVPVILKIWTWKCTGRQWMYSEDICNVVYQRETEREHASSLLRGIFRRFCETLTLSSRHNKIHKFFANESVGHCWWTLDWEERIRAQTSCKQIENLRVKVKDRTKKSYLVVEVCYRHLIRGSLSAKPSYSRYRRHPAHKLSTWEDILATQMPAGEATQMSVSDPGTVCNRLPRETVDFSSLEVFKGRLGVALTNLV